ncbi:Type II secretory pathway component [Idiomarina sp. HP20-50]|uniref:Type II secretory pathway component n=1 Tax=Idiomarina sp. HP20-50 TaxID=3070813 RepID=UPI00294B2024|nr:Type II secretory pathway component [Idiomarina sp. HP20-50]MDV6315935.1 Type II secretory pathway component [Idiomarina sp. HP20-50]
MLGFSKQKQNDHRICFQITQTSVRILIAKESAKAPELIVNDYEQVQNGSVVKEAAALLAKYSRLPLKQAQVTLVLGTDLYESVQVDRPMLDPEEISESLKYSLSDLVSFSADDVIADYYEFPEQPSGQDKIVAVAASKHHLTPWVEFLNDRELLLTDIAIAELTLPRLSETQSHAELLLYQNPTGNYIAQINTPKGLMFSRLLRGVSDISNYTKSEMEAGALEPLATELQRSVDYFESHLRQAPISRIVAAVEHTQLAIVEKCLTQLLAVDCTTYQYPEWAIELREGDYSDLAGLGAFSGTPS